MQFGSILKILKKNSLEQFIDFEFLPINENIFSFNVDYSSFDTAI